MEDYILKEIRKITMLLEALVKKTAAEPDGGYEIIRQELIQELDMDIDEVVMRVEQILSGDLYYFDQAEYK